MKRRSLIFWLSWIIVGGIYELFAVIGEKKTGDQPLTRVFRDRLMQIPRWGKVIQIVVMGFLGWWFLHWAAGLSW
jgi:hypothetical protein